MRVVISAGGTGGHIYPALAIIHKIKQLEPDSEFLYIGTHNRMEKDIIPKENIPFQPIEIYGFHRKHLWKNFRTLHCFSKAIQKCKKMIREFQPDVVIGVGGYVTAPVIYSAKKLGFKTVIHEQNSVPGKANLFLSKYADRIMVSFKSTIKNFPEYKTIFTGNPCGENAIKAKEIDKKTLGFSLNKKLVLFVMGSLGSSRVNSFLIKTMKFFEKKDYEILFVTGKSDYEHIQKETFPSNVHVVSYIENMTSVMKQIDLIVSRAGASTLSEIIALEIPSILIPSPYVPDNHQFKNAKDLIDQNAAILIEEKYLKGDILVRTIDELLSNKEKLQNMKRQLKEFKIENSATLIYHCIKEMIDGGK